ncbi:hydroxypyruvate isomerase [Thorsellia anophelis]|uniref:Hydroxypyruvate isomerase n=1 Tax=Thorsellia anophelis DSM 18579 TaxID=1123402 RepID=A0A1I0CNT7_9GAMM|nr:hydroxypyruvate isomerase [Thorsellia anophelis]SET20675.1 hydroxypyruvate isomerase [Thorsellia anophelis DSM 18579]
MAKFCANLTMLFNEVDFLARFEKAKLAGFKGVEYLFPYDFDKNQLADLLQTHQLEQVLHNLPAGDWGKGERGIAILPERVNEFQDGVGKAIEYATALNCKQVNVLVGIAPEGIAMGMLQKTLISNLRFAAKELKQAGIKLLMEPINYFDIPGFFVNRTQQAVDILEEVGSDNLYIQYDIYHMQRMEGELVNTIKQNLSKIAHIQLADNPGRNEPGTGEINYPFLFKAIDEMGYTGWIGAEYKPLTTTEAGLSWLTV